MYQDSRRRCDLHLLNLMTEGMIIQVAVNGNIHIYIHFIISYENSPHKNNVPSV